MSLLTVLFNDFLEDLVTPAPTLFDQHFGVGLNPILDIDNGYPRLSRVPFYSGYMRPWRNTPSADSGMSSLENTRNEFKVNLDVQQFKAEEIKVKLQDNPLIVEGKHEERQDKHEYISRQFQRLYALPENVDETKITSTLSTDNVLTLRAPKKQLTLAGGEREIPIEATNKPAIKQSGKRKPDQENMES